MIVVLLLAAPPGIESFIHDNQPHPVTKIEQLRRRWIVARANRIYSHFFQDFYLAFQSSGVDCSAERPQVVMIANAVELYVPAVKQESFFGVKLNGAYSENSFISVDHLAVMLKRSDGCVQVRCFQVPESRALNLHSRDA